MVSEEGAEASSRGARSAKARGVNMILGARRNHWRVFGLGMTFESCLWLLYGKWILGRYR